MALDIAKGMFHLHKEHIIHRDLAARNLLLDKSWNVKIADFGLSRVNKEEYNVTYTKGGPLRHMAPESLIDRKYSIYSDVWAFGVTLIEIVTRDVPFPHMDGIQVAVAVVNKSLRPTSPEGTPSAIVPIVNKCFGITPSSRPTFSQICEQMKAHVK